MLQTKSEAMDAKSIMRNQSSSLVTMPESMIQYGVKLASKDGRLIVESLRWRDWNDAAEFGERQVNAGEATGFWVFREASV